jgi:hypothetical protein
MAVGYLLKRGNVGGEIRVEALRGNPIIDDNWR